MSISSVCMLILEGLYVFLYCILMKLYSQYLSKRILKQFMSSYRDTLHIKKFCSNYFLKIDEISLYSIYHLQHLNCVQTKNMFWLKNILILRCFNFENILYIIKFTYKFHKHQNNKVIVFYKVSYLSPARHDNIYL